MDQQTPTEQAPAPSVEDRIASIFQGKPKAPANKAPAPKEQAQEEEVQEEPTQTEETEAASESEEDTPAEDTFELEHEGQKYRLPKALEKGFMQEKDYTQKSQSVAEQRRTLEMVQRQQRIAAMSGDFAQQIAQEQQQLQMIDWALSQPINWQSLTTDEAIRKKIELDDWREQRGKIEKTIEGKRGEWGSKQAQEIAKLRAESLEVIQKKIPGWTEATAKEIRQHALSDGYTEEELNAILDPRHAVTLWKAQQFDKLKSSAKQTVASVKNVKTTATSSPMPQNVKDKLAYRKAIAKTQPGSAEQRALVTNRIAKIFG